MNKNQQFTKALLKIMDEHKMLGREALAFLQLRKWVEELPEALKPKMPEVMPIMEEKPVKKKKTKKKTEKSVNNN